MKLEEFQNPDDLTRASDEELTELAENLRRVIIQTVSENGGHLASNLGVVELTIALLKAFDLEEDRILFDVGHQCYPFKLLTGRKDRFSTLRQWQGISGFPRADESPYDLFSSGHASSALSAALGLARARDLQHGSGHVVAVVGDGALTGGMCYEALNDAGSSKTRLILILNDNGMSISGNVGALSQYLTFLRTSKGWIHTKKTIGRMLQGLPIGGEWLYRHFSNFKDHIRNIFVHDTFFSSLGFRYFGPIDGHNIRAMTRILNRAKQLDEPVMIHAMTQKGRGYAPAEDHPDRFHGIVPFYVENGEPKQASQASEFGPTAAQYLLHGAETDPRLTVVTAAMTEGTGFGVFQSRFPDRLFDVGITEEHAVTMAAGLAKGGMKPVVAIYDTFLQRGFDQLVEDIGLQDLPVVFLLDRAGLSASDGATHHGVFGLSYLAPIPNFEIFCPATVSEMLKVLEYALKQEHPVAIRYPKQELVCQTRTDDPADVHRWQTVIGGRDCVIIAAGSALQLGEKAVERLKQWNVDCGLVHAGCIKPLDRDALHAVSAQNIPYYTLEEHSLIGGFGSQVAAWCVEHDVRPPARLFGIPDRFIAHGDREALLKDAGLDAGTIAEAIQKDLKRKTV
ncbi:MAG: 1-deoxy-D-xylulose-5-phosphate synthase [Clostridia bacterium]|nr:1-deoxy-D-xylulose-5-phosphate synthase [Clostridia bacterium]